MQHYQETTSLPYSASNIYQIVWDIKSYPEFLPWCIASRILKISEFNALLKQEADLIIGFKMFRERFRSNVTSKKNCWIETEAIQGPFRKMKSRWEFKPKGETLCEVSFEINFEFHSKMLETIAGRFFKSTAEAMVDSFAKRAHDLYQNKV